VFENKMQWKVFGIKTDETSQRFKLLHNEELHELCKSPSNKGSEIEDVTMAWTSVSEGGRQENILMYV
jgi:hypothetical protein